MALLELGPIMFGGTTEMIAFFRTRRGLASVAQCSK